MTEDELLYLSAELVAAYVQHNSVSTTELPSLIGRVYGGLIDASQQQANRAAPVETKPEPAVTPTNSVFADHIVSLIDGKSYKSLKRHIGVHGYTPQSYRTAYDLPADYPMVCPDYSEARSNLAKTIGLGRKAPANELAA